MPNYHPHVAKTEPTAQDYCRQWTGVKRTGGVICWLWCQSIFVKALRSEGIVEHH